jgi:hypothetical protein
MKLNFNGLKVIMMLPFYLMLREVHHMLIEPIALSKLFSGAIYIFKFIFLKTNILVFNMKVQIKILNFES